MTESPPEEPVQPVRLDREDEAQDRKPDTGRPRRTKNVSVPPTGRTVANIEREGRTIT